MQARSKFALGKLCYKLYRAVEEFWRDLVHVFKLKGLAECAAMLLLDRAMRHLVLDCDD